MDYQRLRRLPWNAATTAAKAGVAASDSNAGESRVHLTAAENIYMAWFILFSGMLCTANLLLLAPYTLYVCSTLIAASLDVVGAEVGRVAGTVGSVVMLFIFTFCNGRVLFFITFFRRGI